MKEIKKAIWNSMLDIDMNQRYFNYLCRRYKQSESIAKYLIAITSSASVGSWAFWKTQLGNGLDIGLIWKILTASSALLSITILVLNYPKLIEKLSELGSAYQILLGEWEYLRANRLHMDFEDLSKAYENLRKKEKPFITKEADIRRIKRLILKCQHDVNKARNLLPKESK